MKFISFKKNDSECPRAGFVLSDNVFDLEKTSSMLRQNVLPYDMLKFLKAGEETFNISKLLRLEMENNPSLFAELGEPLDNVTILPPIKNPEKIICVGLNYREHAKEGNNPIPDEPLFFGKFANSIIGSGDYIKLTQMSDKVDYEAELGVVIGKKAYQVSEEEAKEHIFGYLNFNDVSSRDLQHRSGQWMKGKFLDTYAPIGPWLVSSDEVGNPHTLSIQSRLNGEVMQMSNTNDMIFSVYYLVSHLSQLLTLEAGDIIATGTPQGVGYARKPPVFLNEGDVIEVEIDKLGILRNTCIRI